MDHKGEVFAVSKWVGIKTKEVRIRLIDEKTLPSVEEARIQIANDMTARLDTLSQEQMAVFATRRAELEEKRQTLVRQYQAERQKLIETQQLYWQDKQQEWRNNFNKGMRGLFDRLTGRRKQIEERNEQEAWQIEMHQQQERDALIFEQLDSVVPFNRASSGWKRLNLTGWTSWNTTERSIKPCGISALNSLRHNAKNGTGTARSLASAARNGRVRYARF